MNSDWVYADKCCREAPLWGRIRDWLCEQMVRGPALIPLRIADAGGHVLNVEAYCSSVTPECRDHRPTELVAVFVVDCWSSKTWITSRSTLATACILSEAWPYEGEAAAFRQHAWKLPRDAYECLTTQSYDHLRA